MSIPFPTLTTYIVMPPLPRTYLVVVADFSGLWTVWKSNIVERICLFLAMIFLSVDSNGNNLKFATICDQPEVSSSIRLEDMLLWTEWGKLSVNIYTTKLLRKKNTFVHTYVASKRIELQNCGWSRWKDFFEQILYLIVFTFSSKNSRDISVFIQAYAPFIIL